MFTIHCHEMGNGTRIFESETHDVQITQNGYDYTIAHKAFEDEPEAVIRRPYAHIGTDRKWRVYNANGPVNKETGSSEIGNGYVGPRSAFRAFLIWKGL